MRSKASSQNSELNGELLVGDFMAALSNRVTAQTAHVIAEQSEADTLQNIASAGLTHSGAYLAPGNIPANVQEVLVRSSVDAHVKKVQAEQVSALASNQLTQMQHENEAYFVGKKVHITIIDQSSKPVESYWLNSQTGQENIGIVTKSSIKGVIRTIALDKNLLIIQPALGSRIINPSRKYFLVYVINPETLTPAVKISLV